MAATLTYEYSVRDRAGKVVTGTIDADSPSAVASKLKSMGYAPLSISEHKNTGMQMELRLPKIGPKVKMKDLAIMSRQFATMINAGLSLLRALNILTEQTENKELAKVLGEVRNDVGPASRCRVVREAPAGLPAPMINITRAGEVGGFLDGVLLQIAENYEAEGEVEGQDQGRDDLPGRGLLHRDPRRRRHAVLSCPCSRSCSPSSVVSCRRPRASSSRPRRSSRSPGSRC